MNGLIISIKEARKLLGYKSTELDDSQIEELIITLTTVAEEYLV